MVFTSTPAVIVIYISSIKMVTALHCFYIMRITTNAQQYNPLVGCDTAIRLIGIR